MGSRTKAGTEANKIKSTALQGCFSEKIITQKKLRIGEKFVFKKEKLRQLNIIKANSKLKFFISEIFTKVNCNRHAI